MIHIYIYIWIHIYSLCIYIYVCVHKEFNCPLQNPVDKEIILRKYSMILVSYKGNNNTGWCNLAWGSISLGSGFEIKNIIAFLTCSLCSVHVAYLWAASIMFLLPHLLPADSPPHHDRLLAFWSHNPKQTLFLSVVWSCVYHGNGDGNDTMLLQQHFLMIDFFRILWIDKLFEKKYFCTQKEVV